MTVLVRARPREFYHSEACQPVCTTDGCSTQAMPLDDHY